MAAAVLPPASDADTRGAKEGAHIYMFVERTTSTAENTKTRRAR